MIKVSRMADYAILLVCKMSGDKKKVYSAHDLSIQTKLKITTISKILTKLTKANITSSIRGVTGGYKLVMDAEDISVGNIIDSVFYGVFYNYAPLFFGRVVDMFYFPILLGQYPDWVPFFGGESFVFFRFIFNVADASITVGAFLLLFFYKKLPLK